MKIIRSLHKLVRKKQKYEWRVRQEKSFKQLKERFKKLVLAASDLNKKNKNGS